MATKAQKTKMQKDAGLDYPPTNLTFIYRSAMNGEGPKAYDWSDKPHRLIYDLCRKIECDAAINK